MIPCPLRGGLTRIVYMTCRLHFCRQMQNRIGSGTRTARGAPSDKQNADENPMPPIEAKLRPIFRFPVFRKSEAANPEEDDSYKMIVPKSGLRRKCTDQPTLVVGGS